MASQAAIDSVKLQLPDVFGEYGITDQIISAQLDATTQTKAILFLLRALAAKVSPVEDVTESGSSRTTQIHARLMLMIADWQARADAEDTALGNLPPKMHARIYTSVRV